MLPLVLVSSVVYLKLGVLFGHKENCMLTTNKK